MRCDAACSPLAEKHSGSCFHIAFLGLALPVALSPGQYLALFAAGGRSVNTVVTLSPDALENCVGRAAAKTIREIGQETAVA